MKQSRYIIFVGSLLASVFVLTATPSADPTSGSSQAAKRPIELTPGVALKNCPVVGNENAAVSIMEFFDYQCPYCAEFHKSIFPKLKEKYIDTGKVRYYFRDYILRSHPTASRAASFASCANSQQKFFEAMDLLFSNPDAVAAGQFEALGRALPGIDPTKLTQCMDSPAHLNEKRGEELFPSKKSFDDIHDGDKLGVRGTPAFVVYASVPGGSKTQGVFMRGLQRLEDYEEVIESFIKASK